jgi:hypothetical protein
MADEARLEKIFRAISRKLNPLNNTYQIDPEKVWTIWLNPIGGHKGLRITCGSPDQSEMPDGFVLTIHRRKTWWRFWQRSISAITFYPISAEEFLRELGKMTKKLGESDLQYCDETDPDSWPSSAWIDLTTVAI